MDKLVAAHAAIRVPVVRIGLTLDADTTARYPEISLAACQVRVRGGPRLLDALRAP